MEYLQLQSYQSMLHSKDALSKYIMLLPFKYKAIQWVPIDLNYQGLCHMLYLWFLINYFLKKHH